MNRLLTYSSKAAVLKPSLLPYGGNGLIATRKIAKDELIFKELPIVSVLKRQPQHSHGRHCLECWTPSSSITGKSSFCESHQSTLLNKSITRLNTQPGFPELRALQQKRLDESNGKEGAFPILITNLIGLSLSDLLTTGSMNSSMNLVNALVKGKDMPPEGIPAQWKQDYEEIKDVVLTGKGLSDLFSLKWYSDQMTRLNLNAMQSFYGEKEEERVVGTSLYLFASMLNHSCVPNVKVDWEDSNIIHAIANKDIAAGEELTITYNSEAAKMGTDERWEYFRYNYGFICTCPLCSGASEVKI
ncbi:SET domain-containing protein [Rhizoclosmatium globosum]|uniref:SET domain-containing protein n=1 Tax=Rhizoclosmatium globosum TaxID=329046 RepID=A0A1Y2CWH0_9FUNG|nr:SET domain-containing protein [Rhizoclosmatium globosum]|eukprot:ORY51379.1 SET domain-containing protein [Rhizoclosmatium globosum]